jgi:hypothetical protein
MATTPTNIGSKLSYAQLESVWISGGGAASLAPLMAAIAEAESSGNPYALNATDNNGTQSSYGLWQISTGTHTAPATNWYDPTVNAQLAVAKLKSQGLGAWGTYTSGAYKQYIQNSTTPDNSWTQGLNGSNGIAGPPSDTSTSSTCIMNVSYGVGSTCLLSKTQARALVGGMMVIVGMSMFTAGIIVIISLGFKKVAPVVGAVSKGPVGMVAKGVSSIGRSKAPAKTSTKVPAKSAPKAVSQP